MQRSRKFAKKRPRNNDVDDRRNYVAWLPKPATRPVAWSCCALRDDAKHVELEATFGQLDKPEVFFAKLQSWRLAVVSEAGFQRAGVQGHFYAY